MPSPKRQGYLPILLMNLIYEQDWERTQDERYPLAVDNDYTCKEVFQLYDMLFDC